MKPWMIEIINSTISYLCDPRISDEEIKDRFLEVFTGLVTTLGALVAALVSRDRDPVLMKEIIAGISREIEDAAMRIFGGGEK